MTDQSTAPEATPLDEQRALEREKARVELEIRRLELEKARSETPGRAQWNNPLIIAILSAAAVAAGNLVVSYQNGRNDYGLEQSRGRTTADLERLRAEQSLVLEAIKAGDTEKAAANLNFLLQAGLLTDQGRVQRLKAYLRTRQPGQGPSLPATGGSDGSIPVLRPDSCKEFAAAGFKVPKIPATIQDFIEVASALGVEPAALFATVQIEGIPEGADPNRPRILFERHIFHRLTRGRFSASHPHVSSTDPGGYAGGQKEYDRLRQAVALDCPAALAATSWGRFQLLGLTYKDAGFAHVDEYVRASVGSERKQIETLAKFLKDRKLIEPLRRKDWVAFARGYNGPREAQFGYSKKLEQAYEAARPRFGGQ